MGWPIGVVRSSPLEARVKHKQKQEAVKRLVVPFQVKAAADPASHTFEGLAAVIGSMDLGNDIIEPGAFTNTLKVWKNGDDAMPLLNSHDQYDIMSALGQLIDAKEQKGGLWTQWEVLGGPEGDAVIARLTPSKKTGRPIVGKMSIGYRPVKWEIEQPEGTTSYFDQVRHLTEVELKECSLVLFPMAPGAAIDASTVKSFLLSAQATSPKTLDVITKAELRRLATRIGILLQKSEPAPTSTSSTEEDEDEEKDTKKPPRAKKPNEPVPPPKKPVEPTPPTPKPKAKADPEHPKTDEEDDDDDTEVVSNLGKADPEHPGNDDEDDDDLDVVADLAKTDEEDEDEDDDEDTGDEKNKGDACPDCSATLTAGNFCPSCKEKKTPKAKGKKEKSDLSTDREIQQAEPYVYQEALEHRLKRLGLKHKVAEIRGQA